MKTFVIKIRKIRSFGTNIESKFIENRLILCIFAYLNALFLKIVAFSDSDSVDKTVDFAYFDAGVHRC